MRLTELHYKATSDVPISKGVCPQQAVGAGRQDVPLVVRQVFFKPQVKGIINLLSFTWFMFFFFFFFSLTAYLLRNVVASPDTVAFTPPKMQRSLVGQGHKRLTNTSLTFLFVKFLTVNFTHKQRSPQRSVTTRGSAVGESSIQELFMDSRALWYG